jgi:hypothetical protein
MLASGPMLGGRTVFAIVILIMLQSALASIAEESGWLFTACIASIWVGWAGSLWVLVRQPLKFSRVIALGLSLAWHCFLLTIRQDVRLEEVLPENARPEKYVTMLGCYGLMQTVSITLLNLPEWTMANEQTKRKGKPQFGILSISVLTTGVAIVMVAANRYAQYVGSDFFTGMVLIMASLLLTSLVAITMSTSNIKIPVGASTVFIVSLGSAAVMVLVADTYSPNSALTPKSFEQLLMEYSAIVSTFGLAMFAFGRCGVADAAQKK